MTFVSLLIREDISTINYAISLRKLSGYTGLTEAERVLPRG